MDYQSTVITQALIVQQQAKVPKLKIMLDGVITQVRQY
jgi:hypothetical protein